MVRRFMCFHKPSQASCAAGCMMVSRSVVCGWSPSRMVSTSIVRGALRVCARATGVAGSPGLGTRHGVRRRRGGPSLGRCSDDDGAVAPLRLMTALWLRSGARPPAVLMTEKAAPRLATNAFDLAAISLVWRQLCLAPEGRYLSVSALVAARSASGRRPDGARKPAIEANRRSRGNRAGAREK